MAQNRTSQNNTINITGVTKEFSKAVQLALAYYADGWIIKVRKIKGHLYLYARKYVKERRERIWKYLSPITEREINFLKETGVIVLNDKNIIDTCKELVANGWGLRVKRRRGTTYISARKWINGKRKEIYISKVTPKEIEELKKLGLLGSGSFGTDSIVHEAVPQCVPHLRNGERFPSGVGNNEWGTISGEHAVTLVPEWMLKGVVSLLLRLRGYHVVEEKSFSLQRIDIYAERDDERLVIEIESSKSKYREGLRQLSHVYAELGDKARYILVLPTADAYIKKTAKTLGFELWTIDEIVKEFCKVSGDSR